jgi:NADPH-dependent 2,4-dienoyl-CoA reductase/sulfur reductase-like enzyme
VTEDLKQTIYYDPASVAGKAPPINDETDILIVGAGPAGLAAALAAAGHGLRVTLVDENPVPLDTMGEEIPLHFGGRMGAAVANHNSVLQTLLDARPEIAEALEAGVDVRLGTAVWGLFPRARWRASPMPRTPGCCASNK